MKMFLALFFAAAFAYADDSPSNVQLDVIYKKIGKRELQLDLYYPKAGVRMKLPLVVYTHGGGWAAGSKNAAKAGMMRKVVDGLNEEGFCFASVDYRLYKKGGVITIKDCVTDCKDAVRFLAKNGDEFGIDPERVFTFGDSAGGQIAQMLLLTSPELFQGDEALAKQEYTMVAGVSWYGPCDFEKTELFNHDGSADFKDRFGPRILPPDSSPADKLQLYREMSPVNYLKPGSPPLLMIQGDGDTTIPVHHAHYMQERAEKIGAPVEISIVENAGHNWRMADGKTPIDPPRETVIERTIDFLANYLSE